MNMLDIVLPEECLTDEDVLSLKEGQDVVVLFDIYIGDGENDKDAVVVRRGEIVYAMLIGDDDSVVKEFPDHNIGIAGYDEDGELDFDNGGMVMKECLGLLSFDDCYDDGDFQDTFYLN